MSTILSLPPIDVLASAAAELAEQAADASHARALNKAAYFLHTGLEIIPTVHGFLIPSGTRAGIIHRVSNVHGCDCEAAQQQRACWHAAALAIIEKAQTRAIPVTDRLAARRKALIEMDELYG